MARWIKFRAWDTVCKNMYYPDTQPGPVLYLNGCLALERSWVTGDFSLMQFTGLKDKNGKEIYEGDVVRAFDYDMNPNDPVIIGTVIFDEARAAWCIHYGPLDTGDTELAWDMGISEYEIIGNIYEDPKLIEQ